MRDPWQTAVLAARFVFAYLSPNVDPRLFGELFPLAVALLLGPFQGRCFALLFLWKAVTPPLSLRSVQAKPFFLGRQTKHDTQSTLRALTQSSAESARAAQRA